MWSGKSTVGRILAGALGWRFVDQDAEVEAQEGRSVAEIFSAWGENHFRQLESRVAEGLLQAEHVVMARGGGWAAGPRRLAGLPAGTLTVWLRVSADEAVRRAAAAPGARPLLTGSDARKTALRLLESRIPSYRQADLEVDTEGLKPEDVSARILQRLWERHPELESKGMRLPHG